MIKLFWNTHNQKKPKTTDKKIIKKYQRDLKWGLYHRKNKNPEEYLYLSRNLTLPSFIATIVTTWYGGILEIGRFSYINGIVTWFIFGFFYYISAIIFALYIGPQIHKNNIQSIPQYFKNNFCLK